MRESDLGSLSLIILIDDFIYTQHIKYTYKIVNYFLQYYFHTFEYGFSNIIT